MNKESTNYNINTTDDESRKPKVGDFALVELNNKTRLFYISGASTLDQLPADIQKRLDENKDFQIVYSTFGDDIKRETPIYQELTQLQSGDRADFSIKRQGGAASSVSLELFDIFGDADQAFRALEGKLDEDKQHEQEAANKEDSSVLYINH